MSWSRGYFEAGPLVLLHQRYKLISTRSWPQYRFVIISTDLAVMRTSLIPGLVKAIAHNTSRQQSRVRLFETGLKFPADQTEQVPMMRLFRV